MLTGWKTFIAALLIAIFGALESFDYTAFLNAENAGYVTTGIAIVMMILRSVTNSPMFKDERVSGWFDYRASDHRSMLPAYRIRSG